VDSSGQVVFTAENGTVFSFNAQGAISTVTSASDALKPANPILTYRGTTGQVDRISDPVSLSGSTYLREVRLVYSGDTAAAVGLGVADSDMSGSACPVLSGFAAPPAGMLCRITYPGHVVGSADTTQLLYNFAGQLVRILDPGAKATDFSYDTSGRLSDIRDSLANDRLAFSPVALTGAQNTTIEYTAGKVSRISLPAPD
jgi:YD repeat-containing protein